MTKKRGLSGSSLGLGTSFHCGPKWELQVQRSPPVGLFPPSSRRNKLSLLLIGADEYER